MQLHALSERAKLGLLCLLLLLMLGIVGLTAVDTYQAVRSFQQQNSALEAGDVSTIHPWMTIHAISHIYRVPENYLYRALQFSDPGQLRHTTLSQLAARKRQPVNRLIQTLQHAILAYRKTHHSHSITPTPKPKLTQHVNKKSHAMTPEPKLTQYASGKSYSPATGRT